MHVLRHSFHFHFRILPIIVEKIYIIIWVVRTNIFQKVWSITTPCEQFDLAIDMPLSPRSVTIKSYKELLNHFVKDLYVTKVVLSTHNGYFDTSYYRIAIVIIF
jgi:hypothetical protein